jgi:histidinol phosphatase-like PHP family hydrolase
MTPIVILDNAEIAELLAVQAEEARDPVRKALRRAARRAFVWPEEAARLVTQGRSLTEFPAVGPYLDKLIRQWIHDPPARCEPPPIRRAFLTLPKARELLVQAGAGASLQGDLQMHTTWSDGSGSVAEMAALARERDYSYIAITDHSQGLKIAGGIGEADLAEQGREIEATNESLAAQGARLRVLRSVELNLNPRGEGDMPESALDRLDIVLGSFHSALRKTEDQTERYLAALHNPTIQILGHPRGRIYNYRLGLTADWPRVFATATTLGKALEIDAYPDRQDLSLDLLPLAREADCYISIGTDAHHPWQLDFIELGLAAAVLAGISKDRILNFMPRKALLEWVARRRHRTISGGDLLGE